MLLPKKEMVSSSYMTYLSFKKYILITWQMKEIFSIMKSIGNNIIFDTYSPFILSLFKVCLDTAYFTEN